MPRTSNKNVPNEARETRLGCYSMVTSKGKTSWHIAFINEGAESGKAYGHTPLVDDKNEEIIYSSKAVAKGFIDGYNFRDNELLADEDVG